MAGPPTRRTLLEQLESEPSLDMARQIYEIAQQHSPAHHLSVRVMASLLAAQFPTEKH